MMSEQHRKAVTVYIVRPLLVVALFSYPVLLIVQGIDFTDMGFNLSNQWLLLHDPSSYQNGYLFYLSNLLGGLWLTMTAPFGLFWIKFGWVLVLYLTMWMAYLTLKSAGPPAGLLVGLIVALLWNTKLGYNWIDYNCLSALIITAAALLLRQGLVNDRHWLLAGGAFLLGVSVLVRFPNVATIGFGLLVPFHAFLERRGVAWTVRGSVVFLSGFAAGIAVIVLLMAEFDHLDVFLTALKQRFSASMADTAYAYSPSSLLTQVLRDYTELLKFTLLAGPLLLVAAWACNARWLWQLAAIVVLAAVSYTLYDVHAITPPWIILGLSGILALAFAYARAKSPTLAESPSQNLYFALGIMLCTAAGFAYALLTWIWLIPGLVMGFLLYQMLRAPTQEQRLVAALALMAMVTTPFGSGNGMINAMFGMWLGIPLAFATLFQRLKSIGPLHRGSSPVLFGTVVVACVMIGVSTRIAYYYTYRDTFDRTRMVVSIDHPLLNGVLTTPERAWVVQELLDAVDDYLRPGEPLLLHGGCALVHLLTDTRPVLGNTWNGSFQVSQFREKLNRFEQSDARSPVVLVSKGSCRDREWPLLQRMRQSEAETLRVLQQFMARRLYELRWQNSFFEIWTVTPGDASSRNALKPGGSAEGGERKASPKMQDANARAENRARGST